MAIEIKELSINVKVNSDSVAGRSDQKDTDDERVKMEMIIDECVQRVLEELSHKKAGR